LKRHNLCKLTAVDRLPTMTETAGDWLPPSGRDPSDRGSTGCPDVAAPLPRWLRPAPAGHLANGKWKKLVWQ